MGTRSLILGLLLPVFAAAPAFGSGGPVEESDFNCKAGTGELVVLHLHQAYSSETRGDAVVYKHANDKGNMLTSMAACVEAGKGAVTPAVDADLAGNAGIVVCGSKDQASAGALSVRANNAGYRALFWKTGSTGKVRVEKNGQKVLGGDLTCQETPL